MNIIDAAGQCLAAGRERVALPFLNSVVAEGRDEFESFARGGYTCPAWNAALNLARGGHPDGVNLILRYMEIGQQSWGTAVHGLQALEAWVKHPDAPWGSYR